MSKTGRFGSRSPGLADPVPEGRRVAPGPEVRVSWRAKWRMLFSVDDRLGQLSRFHFLPSSSKNPRSVFNAIHVFT